MLKNASLSGFCILFFLLIGPNLKGQPSSFEEVFKEIFPGISINKLAVSDHFKEEYEILIPQMVDHKNPKAGFFNQRIFLSHYDFNSPVVFVSEGYAANDVTYELSSHLKTNQIIVEYRYFGKSIPEEKEWKYLTNKQAMKDLHRVHTIFSKIYKTENWITTGISKGGTTCLFYKAAYPKDSRIAVPYVGPMPNGPTDKRCDEHLMTIGDESCRQALKKIQTKILSQREAIIPKIDSLAEVRRMKFSMGTEMALEYSVLELSFSFWQYASDCSQIPSGENAEENFQFLSSVSGFDLYSDKIRAYYEPAFYQFLTENGYYGFVHDHLKDQIRTIDQFDNSYFGPQDVDLSYNSKYMKRSSRKLKKKKRILQIHGEYDPWAACGLELRGKDQHYFVREKGSHVTRINSFSQQDQDEIWQIISGWLK